jgi:hypothetical protein
MVLIRIFASKLQVENEEAVRAASEYGGQVLEDAKNATDSVDTDLRNSITSTEDDVRRRVAELFQERFSKNVSGREYDPGIAAALRPHIEGKAPILSDCDEEYTRYGVLNPYPGFTNKISVKTEVSGIILDVLAKSAKRR